MPPQPPQNNPVQTPPPEKKTDDIAPIHTYKSDVAGFIKTEGKTMADIAIAENARHSKYMEEEAAEPVLAKRAVTIALVAVILIALSAGIIWIASLKKPSMEQTASNPNYAPAMFISGIDKRDIPVDNLDLSRTLNSITAALQQSSPFLVLNITTKSADGANTAIDSPTFFNKLGIYPPADLLRALSGQFAAGSIGGQARFLVIKTNYYAGAFSGMFEWENAIANDLRNFLNLPLPNNSGIVTSGSGASTTVISTNQSSFIDAVISNRDARVFKDGAGATILLYLFPDNNTIIITGSENAAKIVTEKLLK